MNSIDTQRLLLEPLIANHAVLLYPILVDPRLYEFLEDEPPASLEALKSRYSKLELRSSPDSSQRWLNWAIRIRESDEYIGYVQATVDRNGDAYVAYVLSPRVWGNGYGREAVSAVMSVLPHAEQVSRFLATVDRKNVRSLRLLKALGFQEIAWANACSSDITLASGTRKDI